MEREGKKKFNSTVTDFVAPPDQLTCLLARAVVGRCKDNNPIGPDWHIGVGDWSPGGANDSSNASGDAPGVTKNWREQRSGKLDDCME